MEIATSRRLMLAGGVALAVMGGWAVGNGDFLLPTAIGVVVVLAVATRLLHIGADAFVAGLVLLGYLVGNRGFAQLNIPGIPLLPAEAALGLGAVLVLWRAAVGKTLPIRVDPFSTLLLAWIAFGTIRIATDLRVHGILALRDFALVYYAGFFFLARHWSEDATQRQWLQRCLSLGFALATPITAAFFLWPERVASYSVGGVPLIFIKGDVAGAFMAAGVFWFGARYAVSGAWGWLALMGLTAGGIFMSNSRAALVAVGFGGVVAAMIGGRRMRRALAIVAAATVLGLFIDAVRPREPGTHSRAFRLYESMRTAVDVSGTYIPSTADLDDKPDNNRFRMVWWSSVFEETREEGLWLGLGFGRDLASEFVRRYYGDSEEFTARSPHNFLLTVFARMGVIGFLPFAGFFMLVLARMWRCARAAPESGAALLWLAPTLILVAACFGVVLEGPMGAVVFWSTLGWAASATAAVSAEVEPESDAASPAVTTPAAGTPVAGR